MLGANISWGSLRVCPRVPCILRISGENLDVDGLLAEVALQADRIWRKSEPPQVRAQLHTDSGTGFLASEADLDDHSRQVEEATAFLEQHVTEDARIAAFPGVDHAVLDFGVAFGPESAALFCYLPPRLIHLVASAGVAVEFSVYACSAENREES